MTLTLRKPMKSWIIKKFPFQPPGATNTKAGIDMAAQVLEPGKGERPEAENVVMLLTDGRPTSSLSSGLNSSVKTNFEF